MARGLTALHAADDSDLISVVEQLGIFDVVAAGERSCSICGRQVTLDTLGAVYRREGETEVLCGRISCYTALLNWYRPRNH